MMKPDSLAELSRQLRLICVEEKGAAARFDGAIGGVGFAAWTGDVQIKLKIPSENSRRTGARMDPAAWRHATSLSAATNLLSSTVRMAVYLFMCLCSSEP